MVEFRSRLRRWMRGKENVVAAHSNKMGLLGATSYIIGNIVGSGIFITPTSILDNAGSKGLALIIWVVGAIISILGAFLYVELGTSIRVSGADFAYICYVKWYPIAFSFMCIGCILNYPATIAIQSQTFSEYIIKGFQIELTGASEFFAKKLIAFALIWLLMFINFFSLKIFVARFQFFASLCKIAATLLIIVTGFYFLIFKRNDLWGVTIDFAETQSFDNLMEGTKVGASTLVNALFAGLYSYDGWDILNFGAEEIERPRRTMPLAIIFGMSTVALIYLSINVSYFAILTTNEILDASAVATTFAEKTLGKAKYLVPFLVGILLIGSLNSTMFSASRYLHAAARQGHLPTFLSCRNTKTDSPRVAVFVCVLLAMAISFTGDLDRLINYVAFAQWSQRAVTMTALIYIRFTHKPIHPEAIQTPFIFPILFFLTCSTLVIVTIVQSIDVSGVGLGILAGGLIVFLLFVWDRSLPSRKWFARFSQYINVVAQIIFNTMPQRIDDTQQSMTNVVHPAVLDRKTVVETGDSRNETQQNGTTAMPPPYPGRKETFDGSHLDVRL